MRSSNISSTGSLKGRDRANLRTQCGQQLKPPPLAKLLGLPAAELHLGAALHLDKEPAAEPRLDPRYPRDIDDLAPVGPEEELGVKPLLHRVERPEKLRLHVGKVDASVVSLALEQANLADLDEPASLPFPHEDPVPRVEAPVGRLRVGGQIGRAHV